MILKGQSHYVNGGAQTSAVARCRGRRSERRPATNAAPGGGTRVTQARCLNTKIRDESGLHVEGGPHDCLSTFKEGLGSFWGHNRLTQNSP